MSKRPKKKLPHGPYPGIRGTLRRTRPGHWAYQVGFGGNVYLEDNTGNWATAYRACLEDVAALRRIVSAGHLLHETYPEILERTPAP